MKKLGREQILHDVKASQPALLPMPPAYTGLAVQADAEKFAAMLQSIGGQVKFVSSADEIATYLKAAFHDADNVLSVSEHVKLESDLSDRVSGAGHHLEKIELAVMDAAFGVQENGAVWLAEKQFKTRVLPFIAEHIAVVLPEKDIVANMHQAYERIGTDDYGFGVFIAGPSKTADIEQSLVLGAHGPKSLIAFILSHR